MPTIDKLMQTALATALLLAAAPAAGLASAPDWDAEPADVPAALRNAHALWGKAVAADDPLALSKVYTADAWLELPCSLSPLPQETVHASWKHLYRLPNLSVSLVPLSFDLARSRDIAVERGRAQYLHLVGGIPYGTNVSYLRVWKQQRGSWLISAEISTAGGACSGGED